MTTPTAPDPLEGQYADVQLIEEAVMAEVRHCEWASTGGRASGCTLCADRDFRERAEAGHYDCAREMARLEGARGIASYLVRGGLRASLAGVVADPRLGEWKRHLDWWAAQR